MEWAQPDFFYLLIIIVPMILWYVLKERNASATIRISSLKGFAGSERSFRFYLRHVPFGLRVIAVALLITVLARPQSFNSWESVNTKGIDIAMAVDISGSMLAEDLKPNRLEAAKNVAINFITGRPNDNIGLVVYSGESFTQCPLTMDHVALVNLFNALKNGMIEDGTAIGLGLANAVNLLKDSEAKSKVIILLTDGMNNAGMVEPKDASDLAAIYGIRVYTIGVGKHGQAPYPFQTPFGVQYQNIDVEIDEDILIDIAKQTGGKYFRATNNESLEEIYNEIDEMEKTFMQKQLHTRTKEEFFIFAFIAACLILLEILIRKLVLRNIP
ncbi:MAG: aerotolerance regulator BatA [Bacteroidetes bacterium GWF2_38_335]|nr:MAG: aerotolerance regulator BatA [Bacteroidetes bacterium GWF2_38_335]OFY78826.1 MAG: aerotolerance regulator BatA [Bacteroidetes bacterium RIFOXYA12_FULL_38_20]HBS85153.1 aerotolerance regulator BatA [Bacteroidales bacterium]